MLRSRATVSKKCDALPAVPHGRPVPGSTATARDPFAVLPAGSTLPLNARSLALSVLLGTHPPELPTRAFVALAELFGIAPGTMRTALSRLVAAGDVDLDDGSYRLVGRHLERQRDQDIGRTRPTSWDGTWHTVVVDDRRSAADRRAFRSVMGTHRFGELRPGAWLRPANLPAPAPREGWVVTTGALSGDPDHELAGRLWDLDALADRAEELLDALADVADGAAADDDPVTIPPRFHVAATVLRFLRDEPLLPTELVGPRWPADVLRRRYHDAETVLLAQLRRFFAGGER